MLVGTSGWLYKDWIRRFYPEDIKDSDKLPYFASQFPTVEVNSTFYRMPTVKSVQRWHDVTPETFVFSVKLNRYLTQTKHLLPDDEFDGTLHEFFGRVKYLDKKLGAILVQLPPSMACSLDRIDHLIRRTNQAEQKYGMAFPLAIEFRHKSWFNPDTFTALRQARVAHVIADSPGRWPSSKDVTADWIYIRFHGNKRLYRSSYTHAELAWWAEFIRASGCKQVFAYFNNDHAAVAVDNAHTLFEEMMGDR